MSAGPATTLSRAEWLRQPHIREWRLVYEIIKASGNVSDLRRAAQERYRVEVERAKALAKAHRVGKGGGKVTIHTELRELLAEKDTATEPEVWAMVPNLDCVVEVIEDPEGDDARCSKFLRSSTLRCAPTAHAHYNQNGRPATVSRRTIQNLLPKLKAKARLR